METQETRTQGVSGTNGMLHEAKVDRRVPQTVHLNKSWAVFRKIMKAGKDYQILREKTGKMELQRNFSVSINTVRKREEKKKVRNSTPVFLVVALSHLPSSAPLSSKNAAIFIMPWNNSRQFWSFGRCHADAGNSRREWNERNVT
ncbi:hypothetical protein CEXT_758871 [Caerostris extrusa]|uniref:Uncharacterized protein n=1 Tax=Caerostris extrusa TaxID=172846 RepID=A0AAV4X2J9_CAEEX|nr:hypothetical protein CEXT_758871 [Caerostris extrusa]